jgi:hypothetical protein
MAGVAPRGADLHDLSARLRERGGRLLPIRCWRISKT